MKSGVCVFAKHPGCGKEYLFLVPDDLRPPHKGDVMLVNTIRGRQVAVASSEFFESPNIEEVATHFPGVYLPLKDVVQIASPELTGFIKNQAKKEVYEELIAAFKKMPAVNPSAHPLEEDIPF